MDTTIETEVARVFWIIILICCFYFSLGVIVGVFIARYIYRQKENLSDLPETEKETSQEERITRKALPAEVP